MPVAEGIEVDFLAAGHLLGPHTRACARRMTILFGGDLGRYDRPVLPDPVSVAHADYLLVESTYGNRVHEKDDDGERLAEVIRATAERGGKLVIPAFAVGRVEELLYWIGRLEEEKRVPVLPVFVDSPMAMEALARYTERLNELDPSCNRRCATTRLHDDAAHEPVPKRQAQAARERRLCAFCTTRLRIIASSAESKQLTQSRMPAIVISSSGMATVDGCCTTSRTRCRTRGTRCCWWASRLKGRVDGSSWTAQIGEDPRSGHSRARRRRQDRIDVGARRLDGNPALARRLPGASEAHVLVHGEPQAMDPLADSIRRSSAGTCTLLDWMKWLHWNHDSQVSDWSRNVACDCRGCVGQRESYGSGGEAGGRPGRRRCRAARFIPEILLERVDDAAVAQLYADGFNDLPLEQKTLIWHLYQAAIAGRDIYYDQRYAHSLEMRDVLEEILTHAGRHRSRHADGDPALHQAVLVEHRSLQQPDGPQVRHEDRARRVRVGGSGSAEIRAKFPLKPGETLDAMLKRMQPLFFDATVDPMSRTRRQDPARTSFRRARTTSTSAPP